MARPRGPWGAAWTSGKIRLEVGSVVSSLNDHEVSIESKSLLTVPHAVRRAVPVARGEEGPDGQRPNPRLRTPHGSADMAVVGGAPSTVIVLLACLVVQIGFGGYGIGVH